MSKFWGTFILSLKFLGFESIIHSQLSKLSSQWSDRAFKLFTASYPNLVHSGLIGLGL
jgi:hypothetical protein